MEIARALGTVEGTIKNHDVSNIISKLGVRERVKAAFKGNRHGAALKLDWSSCN